MRLFGDDVTLDVGYTPLEYGPSSDEGDRVECSIT